MSGLSVVVVSWNTRDLTLSCVDAVRKASCGFVSEVGEAVQCIVVDNGSTDGTAAALRGADPELELVALRDNLGFAAGANAGAAVARGDVLLFLNTDALLDASTLIGAWRHLATHPRTAVVGPQLIYPDGRLQNSAHAFPSIVDELAPGWLIDLVAPHRRPAKRSVGAAPTPVDAVQGAAMFVRRSVFGALGGFSESYFFYLEETDLCARVRRAGHHTELLPGLRVTHAAGASSKRVSVAASRIEFHRSLYRFLASWHGPATVRTAVALRTLRGAVTVGGLALSSIVWAGARSRRDERAALLRWHLAGRPPGTGLAELDSRSGDASG